MLQIVGLMSGTSLDAVDAVLCRFDEAGKITLEAAASLPLPQNLRDMLWGLTQPGSDEINTLLLAERQLTECYVDVVRALLDKQHVPHDAIAAVGCHGQTIRHQRLGKAMYTLQLGDIHWLSVNLGIPCVGDFRRADIALGGEGAPLLPAFHEKCFRSLQEDRAVVNLGGIANVTLLPKDRHDPVRGFDTGPGNGLMDSWAQHCWQEHYDKDGLRARQGTVHQGLLQACLDAPYFAMAPPKSTGRDTFHLDWLRQRYDLTSLSDVDVQATLLALTARSVAEAILVNQPNTKRVILSGGGTFNPALVEAIASYLPEAQVETSESHGIAPQWVEACGFAWLAYRRLMRLQGNLPTVTGAKQGAILGTLVVQS